MQIRCKLERDGGTQVRIDQTDYDFQPTADGHVAEVADPDHVQRFLSAPEAYVEVPADPPIERYAPVDEEPVAEDPTSEESVIDAPVTEEATEKLDG